jgi:hypothetical protein
MIAAIVIPIIFLYFLYITIKERKRRIEKWQQIGTIKEETFLRGKVIQSFTRSKRYIGNYFVSETTLLIKNETDTYKAIITVPITPTLQAVQINNETTITCFGYWDKKNFIFSRYRTHEDEKK